MTRQQKRGTNRNCRPTSVRLSVCSMPLAQKRCALELWHHRTLTENSMLEVEQSAWPYVAPQGFVDWNLTALLTQIRSYRAWAP